MELNKKRSRTEDESNDNTSHKDQQSNTNSNEEAKPKKNEMPNFLMKLYKILETNEYNDIIEWGDNGRFFVVKNLNEFTQKVLPNFYKHNNFSSFVRQLNMYDFHKKRNCNNENIFSHKNFIRGQKNLIKTIRRKNHVKNQHNPEDEEQTLIDYCTKELNSAKRVSKTTLEKALTYLMKTLNEANEKQKFIENKVENLGKQNEEFIVQNQQMLQEIKAKSDYTKKLETLLFLMLEVVLPKNSFKPGDSMNIKSNIISTGVDNTAIQNFSQGNFAPALKFENEGGSSVIKNFIERFLEKSSGGKPLKMDIPMISDMHNSDVQPVKPNLSNNSLKITPPFLSPTLSPSYSPSPYFKICNTPLDKLELEEEKSVLFRGSSPNPFMEGLEYTGNQNLFNSPSIERLYNQDDIIIGLDNLNKEQIKIVRNDSPDVNEIFKNGEIPQKKDEHLWIDDSIFSVSSNPLSDKNTKLI